jgi:hypothetical protein
VFILLRVYVRMVAVIIAMMGALIQRSRKSKIERPAPKLFFTDTND